MIDSKFILYAEDDHHYGALMENVFRQAGLPHHLRIVKNGSEVVAYLRGDGRYSNRFAYPLPGVVLLDLKMPVMNGFETLAWIRQKSPNPQQPVVVLTCSEDLTDIKKAYELGANSFLTKPPNVDDLLNMVRTLDNYWLNQNSAVPLRNTPLHTPDGTGPLHVPPMRPLSAEPLPDKNQLQAKSRTDFLRQQGGPMSAPGS
jgi:CheY-like chemotaxis protein